MCGIIGFFETRPPAGDPGALKEAGRLMASALSHRGPDDGDIWADPDRPLVLGHRRLSIVDLSPEGRQPMMSASGRYVITFNGEIYNFPDLRRELELQGATFRGRSDTEVMLAGFDLWGVARALQKINGMFAFALWDRQTRQLHLIRDRLGKKPLYTGWSSGGALIFASELKAFHTRRDVTPVISRDALALYMRYGYVPAPYSIYENVWQILPGCALTIDTDNLTPGTDLRPLMTSYWHLPRVVEDARNNPVTGSDDDVIREFENLLTTCVRDRMIADVPLGAFLSGGIDSSAVTALMQRASTTPVRTFTVGFAEDGYDEAAHAAAIARHLGTDHHEIRLSADEALKIIPRLPDMYDEPFSDESQIPTFLVSEFARRHVTVALSGDGGDEVLGGYTRHRAVPMLWARAGWLPHPARKILATAIERRAESDHHYKAAAALRQKTREDAALSPLTRWPDNIVKNSSGPPIPLHDPAWYPANLSLAERMMYADALHYLPHDILTKVDRASMAVALECRSPLLDRRVFEYSWRLPARFKIRNSQGKWLLRQVLARHVPPALFERPKQGFSIPLAAWLRGPLREWAEDHLSEHRLTQDDYLNTSAVKAVWDEFKNGGHHHAPRLWTVLMFQAWLQRWHSKGYK